MPPHNSGGLGVACLNLARALSAEGAEIDFVVPYTAEHEDIEFMKVVSALPYGPLARYGMGAYYSGLYERSEAGREGVEVRGSFEQMREVQSEYVEFVKQYLMEYKPDVVHVHDWLTMEAGVLAKKNYGIPLVAHVHATEFDRAGANEGNPVVREIEREGLVMADKIFAVSKATKKIIHEKYHIPLEKIDVAYNSLDEDFLKTVYEYQEEDYAYIERLKAKGWTVISTVGRFTIQKGLYHMMQAAALAIRKNPKLLFVFAGDGEERNELISLSAKLGISKHVIFTGFVRGKKLRDIYSLSDVFVMSSVSEPFGLTALEAAHYGDALILTKQSGVSEVLKSALLYDFWDEQKLAEEMVAVSKNTGLKRTMQKNVKKEYRKISWEDVAKKCMEVYRGVKK